MRVVIAKPPLFDLINAAFNIEGKPVIFAWGDKIYNPTGCTIAPQLMDHEAVHGKRQISLQRAVEYEIAIREWWGAYCADPEFRLQEEIPAHRAEYLAMLRIHGDNRTNRRRFLVTVAARMAAPLYGRICTVAEAKRYIRGE